MSDILNPEVFRTVLENLQNGVYLVNLDRKILFWNQGAEKITGYLSQEVVGRFCRDNILAHCDQNNSLLCAGDCPLTDTMRNGSRTKADVYVRHKNGHRLPVRVECFPLRDPHGTIIGAAESFHERRLVPHPDRRQNNALCLDGMDEVTGLPNYALTELQLRQTLSVFAQQPFALGIMRLQVDQLSRFQASHGRLAADSFRRVTAQTLRNTLRPGDILGCWGEGEFLIILKDCPPTALPMVGERLRKMVSFSGITWWGDRLPATISIGGVAVRQGDTVETVLERSERSLYDSLKLGGDRVTIFIRDTFPFTPEATRS